MEPPAQGAFGRVGTPADEMKLLARAPVKIWDGLFSIRVGITIAGRKLDGRFLIDSGTGTSVVSPEFLEGQGILSAWIEVPDAPFRRVPWGANGSSRGGLAPMAAVDLVTIGNYPLKLKEFAVFDTEFFAPPESPGSCCDGVLGTDFLRDYVVELRPGPPAEVKLWPAESFHLATVGDAEGATPQDFQWVETALTPAGEVVSSCIAHLDHGFQLVGVRWDTGRENAMDVHLPWQKQARGAIASITPMTGRSAVGWALASLSRGACRLPFRRRTVHPMASRSKVKYRHIRWGWSFWVEVTSSWTFLTGGSGFPEKCLKSRSGRTIRAFCSNTVLSKTRAITADFLSRPFGPALRRTSCISAG